MQGFTAAQRTWDAMEHPMYWADEEEEIDADDVNAIGIDPVEWAGMFMRWRARDFYKSMTIDEQIAADDDLNDCGINVRAVYIAAIKKLAASQQETER